MSILGRVKKIKYRRISDRYETSNIISTLRASNFFKLDGYHIYD